MQHRRWALVREITIFIVRGEKLKKGGIFQIQVCTKQLIDDTPQHPNALNGESPSTR